MHGSRRMQASVLVLFYKKIKYKRKRKGNKGKKNEEKEHFKLESFSRV